jgi:hypothetical protein
MVSCAGELFRRGVGDETIGQEMRVISKDGKTERLQTRKSSREQGRMAIQIYKARHSGMRRLAQARNP